VDSDKPAADIDPHADSHRNSHIDSPAVADGQSESYAAINFDAGADANAA